MAFGEEAEREKNTQLHSTLPLSSVLQRTEEKGAGASISSMKRFDKEKIIGDESQQEGENIELGEEHARYVSVVFVSPLLEHTLEEYIKTYKKNGMDSAEVYALGLQLMTASELK